MAIIVGVDLSSATPSIVDLAGAIARARGERLLVVHAVDGPVLPRHRDRVHVEVARARAAGVAASAVVESAGVPDLLAQVATREGEWLVERSSAAPWGQGHEGGGRVDACLIVVGAQGEGRRPLLGTAATAVLRRVPQPVLVVRAPERLAALLASSDSGPDTAIRLRVLVCASLDETGPGVVDALKLLADVAPLDAEVAHFQLIPEPPGERRDAIRLATRDLVESLGPLPAEVHATALVRDAYGRLDVNVGDLARARHADLVICGSHRRHGLDRLREGSVAEGIVRHAPVSVLVGAAPRPAARAGVSAVQGGSPR